jgi:mono/diheme cytochrome c family protein
MNFKSIVLFLLLVSVTQTSCYYDNEEYLYPNPIVCDTLAVSYSQDIAPIIQSNCLGCHSGAAPSGDIDLSTYSNVMLKVNDNSLLNAVRYNNLNSPMPPSGKMSNCNINNIAAWIHQGAQNN